MRRPRTTCWGWVAALGLLASGPAAAVEVGGKLYVKARNTRVMASTSPTASTVVVLQPGDEVTWQGKAPEAPWHKVSRGAQTGYVLHANLSLTPPPVEIVGKELKKGQRADLRAFASSGAATKALSEGAKRYAQQKGIQDAMRKLQQVERVAEDVSPKQVSAFAREQGLNPVVGGGER
jgi:hypothetical protein